MTDEARSSGIREVIAGWVEVPVAATVPTIRPYGPGSRRRDEGGRALRRWAITAIVAIPAASGPSGASTPANAPALQPMTLAQVMDAGAAGTGCSWSLSADRRMRFAAAGDRAAIRLAGRTTTLSPVPHARELFPFTFADWRAEGLTIRIELSGRARRLGTEVVTQRATLTVVVRGTSRRMDGTLSCGS